MAATVKPERIALTGEQIESAATLFAPTDGSIHDRVLWIISATESTNGNATAVAKDVETYYQLQGRKAPRGYGRASIVNAGTDAVLWERTGCGNTADTKAGNGAAALVGAIDAARHAHGAKTVRKLIDATAESLQTDVKPLVRYRAMLDAIRALAEAPEAEKTQTERVLTLADILVLLDKAGDIAEQIDASADIRVAIGSARSAVESSIPAE